MSPDLTLALALADAADAISLPGFRAGVAVSQKADLTPVTDADLAVEAELRRLVAEARPGDAISGEEHGTTGGGTRRWILDPIDGTRNFARGIPVWATLIALEENERVSLGVVSAPALGMRWHAERGAGAFRAAGRLNVSTVGRIEDAVLSFALDRQLPEIAARAAHVRGFGDFWAHMLVAEGGADAAVDAVGVAEWDLAAVQVIVEEAGGRFSDWGGNAALRSGTALSSNGLLHEELLGALDRRETAL
jgi:histidinol-phosphatase